MFSYPQHLWCQVARTRGPELQIKVSAKVVATTRHRGPKRSYKPLPMATDHDAQMQTDQPADDRWSIVEGGEVSGEVISAPEVPDWNDTTMDKEEEKNKPMEEETTKPMDEKDKADDQKEKDQQGKADDQQDNDQEGPKATPEVEKTPKMQPEYNIECIIAGGFQSHEELVEYLTKWDMILSDDDKAMIQKDKEDRAADPELNMHQLNDAQGHHLLRKGILPR